LPVLAYLVKRLADVLVVVFGVSTIVFGLLRLSGDPVALLVPPDATAEQVAALRQAWGFNDPLYVQYVRFLRDAATGSFGQSVVYRKPASTLILEVIPNTLKLTLAALTLSVAVAIPVGIISALKRNTILDTLSMGGTLLGQAMPTFWLGILLIMVFAVGFRILPTSGMGTWRHLILPTVTLAAYSSARTARLVRSGMLDVLGEDYVRTARAKGLAERRVIVRHALRNVSIPVVTMIGLSFGAMLAGAIVTETVFAWPGVGRAVVEGIFSRDYPVVQAGVFYISLVFALMNLVVDMLYVYLDPRIRHQ